MVAIIGLSRFAGEAWLHCSPSPAAAQARRDACRAELRR
jgi:hypothetical protein